MHGRYQVEPHSSPWFSAACAAAIVHKNPFIRLYSQNKSSGSKVNFRQASNRCKKILELSNLHMLITQKNPSLSRNSALGSFEKLRIVLLTKENLLHLITQIVQRGIPIRLCP